MSLSVYVKNENVWEVESPYFNPLSCLNHYPGAPLRAAIDSAVVSNQLIDWIQENYNNEEYHQECPINNAKSFS